MKILCVDDDIFIRELLPLVLDKVGYLDVETTASGPEALDILNRIPIRFDCLLLDINMPGMDGIELCSHIRNLPAYRHTPIIILTAMTEKKYIDEAFRAGATDYLTKPFDVAEVGARLRLVEELVTIRRTAAQVADSEALLAVSAASKHRFSLDDDLEIEGETDCLTYRALRNYLLQLSRAGLGSVQVLAVKIDPIKYLYEHATSTEFVYVLHEVAAAIGEIMRPTGCVMTYAGNGIFLVISNKPTLEPSRGLETDIQELIDELHMEFDNGRPMDIVVSIGNPIRPSTNPSLRARHTFERAIERAENGARAKSAALAQPNIRHL